jgi:hypothetical protein
MKLPDCMKIPHGTQERQSARMKAADERLLRAERRLVRAMNGWQAARLALKRLDKRQDKNIKAEMDWRELAKLDDKDLDDPLPVIE